MITRSDYLKGSGMANHRRFYAQFVNDEVKRRVLYVVGKDRLLKSKDEHLNDVPMKLWDFLTGYVFAVRHGEQIAVQYPRVGSDILPVSITLLRQAEEGISNASLVCIYKEAGRQLIEELKTERTQV